MLTITKVGRIFRIEDNIDFNYPKPSYPSDQEGFFYLSDTITMKLHIQWRDFLLQDLSKSNLDTLSKKLSEWQKNENFMRFLKETPMSPSENFAILENKLSDHKNVSKLILQEYQREIVGFVLFDEFDSTQNSLESYTRIDPNLAKIWLGSLCRKMIIENLLLSDAVSKIISWHSARNTWSLCINRNAWFKLIDFEKEKTFLPNIHKFTDDFKWEIEKEDILDSNKNTIIKTNYNKVIQWLIQHELLSLLQ